MNNSNPLYLLISPDEIDELAEKGRTLDEICWWLGNRFWELWSRVEQCKSLIVTGHYQTEEDIENAILALGQGHLLALFEYETGKARRTVRRYAELAAYYSLGDQERFQFLPMSHFEFAKQYPEYAEEILEVDLRLADANNGKPRALTALKRLFPNLEVIPEVLDMLYDIEDISDILALSDWGLDLPENVGDNEDQIPEIVFRFLHSIDMIAKYIQRAVLLWDIPEQSKANIINLVLKLENEIASCRLTQVEKQ